MAAGAFQDSEQKGVLGTSETTIVAARPSDTRERWFVRLVNIGTAATTFDLYLFDDTGGETSATAGATLFKARNLQPNAGEVILEDFVLFDGYKLTGLAGAADSIAFRALPFDYQA